MCRKGLRGIAITDHDTIEGGRTAKEIIQAQGCKDCIIIVGTEIKTEIGDIIGLFLTREIHSRRSLDVIDEIHSQGGLSILAHPFRTPYILHARGKKTANYEATLIQQIDLIEIANARSKPSENLMAMDLALRYHKPVSAGSDAHFPPEIGATRLITTDQDISTETDIKNHLLNATGIPSNKHPILNNLHWYVVTALLSYMHKLKQTFLP